MYGDDRHHRPFEAVLYPNPPMSRTGFLLLAVLLLAASTGIGTLFWLAGAWPVTGFLGLDVLGLLLAFLVVRRAARRHEIVRIDEDGMVVRRVEPDGSAREWHFEPYWVRVEVDDRGPGAPHLVLASHGRRLVLGSFLAPEERLEFAEVLREVLWRRRNLCAPA